MSENIPESIPTSQDRRSQRPVKKARGPTTAISAQASAVEALFAKQPDIQLPSTILAKTSSSLAPAPELIANIQGSSAGAGSGDFHVYKASRRREYERIKLMEQEAQAEEDTRKWEQNKADREKKDSEKMSKNKRRREKAKARKDNKGMAGEKTEDTPGRKGPNPTLTKTTDDGDNQDAGVAAAEEPNGIVIHDDD